MRPRDPLRFGADTGGTFTDLVIDGWPGGLRFYKRATTPADPISGVLEVLGAAGSDLGETTAELLGRGELFVFGTTRATNAIVTGTTAKTALLVTAGHPDTLLWREGGGRTPPLDFRQRYPDPYIPRALTFEIPERVLATGEVDTSLDEPAVLATIERLRAEQVEAVAVCLLFSMFEPAHELRVGELLDEHLPGVPYTLSHHLNPAIREYRRASSTAIDASLKPLMGRFFRELEGGLAEAGYKGRLMVLSSGGGALDADSVADAPIHSIGSGPAAAPVAGRHFARVDAASADAIVTDAGGTTFDVSLIRKGAIPWTRETVVGHGSERFHTGFASVDVRSIGAGGGSIAWVDEGGLLHVGPESAGADPGPVCYGRGGARATVTDACLVLGYIDHEYFLGGAIAVDVEAARAALTDQIASSLGLSCEEAAAAVLELAVERMVNAIEEITLFQGIDATGAVLVGGGGGAGLYSAGIARRLGCAGVVMPAVSAALSATGALLSDLQADFTTASMAATGDFHREGVNAVLDELSEKGAHFLSRHGFGKEADTRLELFAEARYPHQVWEIELPLRVRRFTSAEDVALFRDDFHAQHEQLFAVRDPDSEVEVVSWRARVSARIGELDPTLVASSPGARRPAAMRRAYFQGTGAVDASVRSFEALVPGERLDGPALVESPVTTIVVPPGASVERLESGSLMLRTWADDYPPMAAGAGVAREVQA